ncbi:MAG TPA: GMC family oxidoreductase N-terminal domain-containing protein [Xanthobacteraceae bacterium]|nr:GMC family oxidoreductase N-terminal domain-containing protein [Xanthobacteraceae bacterium]
MAEHDFDYIIVGAGSAGCVLANRLSADPAVRVCLIEAGPSDRTSMPRFKTRIPIGNVMMLPTKRYNWGYSFKGDSTLGNRAIPSHRGRVFGGSSSVNGMVYMRGHSRDYDEWGEQGNPGWNWPEVLKAFKRHENHERGANEFHGVGGELNVAPPRYLNPVTRAFVAAAGETQFPVNVDFNSAEQDGFGPWEVTQKNGQRWNSARAFLHPVYARKNLTVMHDTLSLRIAFNGRRAAGLKIRQHGREIDLTCRREVILSSGAYNSPHLLMLSGVGNGDELRRHGIEVVHHLPGVGKNLQDHPTAWIEMAERSGHSMVLRPSTFPRYAAAAFKYVFARRGPLTSNVVEAGGFIRTKPGLDRPDIQYVFMPAIRPPGQFMPRDHGMTLMPVLLRPKSRGEMELVSQRPEDKPILHPRFLDNAEDMDALVQSMRIGRQILSAPALAPFCSGEVRPGPKVQSREQFEDFLRATVMTSFHPVGTCKMAPESDPMAVVDHTLRVRGIDGLRVIDASIMPTIVGGNTNAPSIMIGERGAQFVLESAKRAVAA